MDDSFSRDETRAFVYWMSGSLRLAEELAEETLGYAASRCLDVLEGRPPRGLPACSPGPFLEPFPDEFYPGLPERGEGAAARFGARESISLAFLAALQAVPVQARAALVLRDVMGRDAVEAGGILNVSGSNLADLLECARDMVASTYDTASGRREPPPEERATPLSMRYIYSWEAGDLGGLLARSTEDMLLQLVPAGESRRGRETVREYLAAGPLAGDAEGARGRWRLLPARANGQLAFGVYRRDPERGMFKAHSLQEIFFAGEEISEIVCFDDPCLLPSLGFLPEVFAQG